VGKLKAKKAFARSKQIKNGMGRSREGIPENEKAYTCHPTLKEKKQLTPFHGELK